MRLAVEREALYTALSRVARIAPKTAANPALSFVKVEVFEDEVFISATDLFTRIVAEVTGNLMIEETGTCLLPAQALTLALRASNSRWVGLAASPGAQVKMGLGKTSYRWKTLPPDHFPDILGLNTEAENHVLDKESFLSAIGAVRPAIQTVTEARFDQIAIRNGVFQAADGNRYHQIHIDDATMVDAALPSDFLIDVLSLAGSDSDDKLILGLSEDKKALSVRIGSTILMTRARAEEFPDISTVFTNARMTNQEALVIDRDELLGAIYRVRMVADSESGAVALKLSPTELEVSARQATGSRATEPVPASWQGTNRTLVLHHSHVVALLGMFAPGTVKLMIGPDVRAKPGSVYVADDTRIGVIMQLRMRWHDDTI